jgi:Zn-finger nucleic acid-binding protein
MRCPLCEDVTLVISSREGIEIDHCPQCRGVWLDRGELDKIIERSLPVAPVSTPSPPRPEPRPPDRHDRDRYDDRYDRSRYDDRYDRKRRKRSFLEDLFDFD